MLVQHFGTHSDHFQKCVFPVLKSWHLLEARHNNFYNVPNPMVMVLTYWCMTCEFLLRRVKQIQLYLQRQHFGWFCTYILPSRPKHHHLLQVLQECVLQCANPSMEGNPERARKWDFHCYHHDDNDDICILGKTTPTKFNEFSENFQTASDPPPPPPYFRKKMLRFCSGNRCP